MDEKEIDEQAVINALRQAQLYDFVDTLPEDLLPLQDNGKSPFLLQFSLSVSSFRLFPAYPLQAVLLHANHYKSVPAMETHTAPRKHAH